MPTKRKPAAASATVAPVTEAPLAPAKPGYQTTEFWLTAAAIAAQQFGPVAEAAGPKTAAVTTAITAGLYTLARAWAKAKGG